MTEANKTKNATLELTEDELREFVRNALMVAGQELGETGDHWPVIKQTIADVMQDWEQLRIERNVHEEMKRHLYARLASMEQTLLTLPAGAQASYAPHLAHIREVYDAFFSKVEEPQTLDPEELILLDEAQKPLHIRRAEAILETLEEDHD